MGNGRGGEGVRREYAIAFGRRVAGDAAVGYAYAGQKSPAVDAERLSALAEALIEKGPGVLREAAQ